MYRYACDQGWDRKPGVNLVHGRWQDVIDEVGWPCRGLVRLQRVLCAASLAG